MTDRIARNTVVSVTYTLRDGSGDVFEHSDLPVSYVHGSEIGLFHKVEAALEGHVAGDQVAVTLAPADGFGDHDASLVFTDDVENVPEELRYVGARLQARNDAGDTRDFVVTHIGDGKFTVDGNHALAGQQVTFELTVHSVRTATLEEIRSGSVGGAATLQ